MDTSELYIKMCDCPEIQLKKKIRLGDYVALRGTDIAAVAVHMGLICRIDGINIQNPENEWIKLPRQDQIQEILNYGIGALVNDFEEFCVCKLNMLECPDDFPKSMEQLWLRFYMHEKHSKVWDKDKWIKK